MTKCTLKPMSEGNRKCAKKYQHQPPPMFMDVAPGGVTPEDMEEARELFKILDDETKDWYHRNHIFMDID